MPPRLPSLSAREALVNAAMEQEQAEQAQNRRRDFRSRGGRGGRGRGRGGRGGYGGCGFGDRGSSTPPHEQT